jgi:hypothetical protein
MDALIHVKYKSAREKRFSERERRHKVTWFGTSTAESP